MAQIGTVYILSIDKQIKIGCSRDTTFKRPINYGPNSIILCIMSCIDPFIIENKLLQAFRERFPGSIGREYFVANPHEAITLFTSIVVPNNKLFNDNVADEIILERQIDMIKPYFSNYMEDVSFGGEKKLICFAKELEEDDSDYDTDTDDNSSLCQEEYTIFAYSIDNKKIHKLEVNFFSIPYKIISFDRVYDMNDKVFCDSIIDEKTKINNVILCTDLENRRLLKDTYESWILIHIETDCIINGKIHVSKRDNNTFYIDGINDDNYILNLHTIRGKKYDRNYLKVNIPYRIHYNDMHFWMKYDDGIKNTDYDLGNSFNSEYLISTKSKARQWLTKCPNDNTIAEMIKNYKKIAKDKVCLNSNAVFDEFVKG
jgi:hypothetical protein